MKKKNIFLLFTILIPSFFCQAQTNTWVGNTTSWNESSNWSLGVVPGPSSSVYIPTVYGNKKYPVLEGNVQVGFFSMHGGNGSIYIGNHELEVQTLWVTYSRIYSEGGTIKTPMVRLCVGMNFYGNLTLYADNGVIGAGNSSVGYGPNTFHGDLTVYAKPHVPAGQNTGQCWPCGGLMFSYSSGDTFKGNFKLIKRSAVSEGNTSYIAFGVYPVNIVFEKTATFVDSSAAGLSLGFTQYGGTVIFKDSTLFSLNSSYVALRGNIEFQRPVTFRQTGGSIELASWGDHDNYDAPQSTFVRFQKELLIDKSGGSLKLGSWNGSAVNSSVIDQGGGIRPFGGGFTGGTVELNNTTINALNVEIPAATHPTVANTGTAVYLNNAKVNGSINIKADEIRSVNSIFNGRTLLQKDGYSSSPNSAGGNTFNKPVELINSAGYDWNLGSQYPDTFKDSLLISLSGTGQHQMAGSNRGAFFKVGMVSGNRFEGPVRIESGATHSGDVLIGNFGSAEFQGAVEISNFRSGNLTFYNSKFRGPNLSRTMTSTAPGVRLLLKDGCHFEGPVSFQVPHFGSDNTTFMKPVLVWKTESGDDSSIGGNTFHQQVQFKNSGANGQIRLLSGEDKVIN